MTPTTHERTRLVDMVHAERYEIARFAIVIAIVAAVIGWVQREGGDVWAPLYLSLRVALVAQDRFGDLSSGRRRHAAP